MQPPRTLRYEGSEAEAHLYRHYNNKQNNMQDSSKEKIIVRFPPSPTGNLHIGNIRTFLFSYLFARKHGGKIVMRFEDTDRERSKKEYEDVALYTLEQLGLDFDEGPYRQSERERRYAEVIEQLIKSGHAYEGEESTHSTSSGQEDGSGDKVIRLKNPNKQVTFTDAVRGEVSIDTTDFGDFVIARSKTNPLYHLTVVVDDIYMGVTHVIRGEDHITSTPRQMLLIEALGGTVPNYTHLPLIIGADKKKLGKRHGAVTYAEFESQGYLPEAIINYLALLGWNPGDDREFFTKDELIKEFSLERINNSPAMFNYDKLDSINKHYINELSNSRFEELVTSRLSPDFVDVLNSKNIEVRSIVIHEIIKERISKFSDVEQMEKEGELRWIFKIGEYDADKLVWRKGTREGTIKHLNLVLEVLSELDGSDESWNVDNIKNAIWGYAEQEGKGDVLWPLRYSLTGMERSPDPITVAVVLGKDDTLMRVQKAVEALS